MAGKMTERSGKGLAAAVAVAMILPASVPLPALAGAAQGGQLVACTANRADVADVSLDNMHYGFAPAYFWVTATVRLTLKDQSVQEYALNGRADPIEREIAPNAAKAGFAYPGFSCSIEVPQITAVENCHSRRGIRTCDIGIRILGQSLAYTFRMMAEPAKMREASLR